MTKKKEGMNGWLVIRCVGAYCSRQVEIGGSTIRYLSEEAERTLVAVNMKNLEALRTDEEVAWYMARLEKSKSF